MLVTAQSNYWEDFIR